MLGNKPVDSRSIARLSILIAMALIAVAVAAPAIGQTSEPQSAGVDLGFEGLVSGTDALEMLGDRIDQVAAFHRRSADSLEAALRHDSTLHLTGTGHLLYVDPAPLIPPGMPKPVSAPYPLETTFTLNSKPGSPRTIYLDFGDSVVLNQTAWNHELGVPNGTVLLPFDIDGNPGSFSSLELSYIQDTWARMAEDYAPFDVNVTTQNPGHSAIHRSGSADQTYGTRITFTNTPAGAICGGCGGVAFVGVFDAWGTISTGYGIKDAHDFFQPALCFAGSLFHEPKYLAECASHEVGHTLGLSHDGITGWSYYEGHSPWAPIMGIGYDQPVSQWSKGEYSGATNTQDDIAIINAYGVVTRSDDHGNSAAAATMLDSDEPLAGIVTTQSDADYFIFTPTEGGDAVITATVAEVSPNLDIKMTMYGPNGTTVLSTSNPAVTRINYDLAGGLSASITRPVLAGENYFIRIEGTGHGTASNGYTKYGSIGTYTVELTGVSTQGAGYPQPGETAGAFDSGSGLWRLFDNSGLIARSFYFGNPGDIPFMGDWDGDGIDTPGLYRQSTGFAYIRFSNTEGTANLTFHFGAPGDVPIVGDWDGDGKDTLSVYRQTTGQVFIINTLPSQGGSPVADFSFFFGNPGDKPFAGDFNGDGVDTVGLHRESSGFVYFRNSNSQGVADSSYFFGLPGDRLIAGDWGVVDGIDTVGVFRPGTRMWYFRHTNTQGFADYQFRQGVSNWRPISGNFGLD